MATTRWQFLSWRLPRNQVQSGRCHRGHDLTEHLRRAKDGGFWCFLCYLTEHSHSDDTRIPVHQLDRYADAIIRFVEREEAAKARHWLDEHAQAIIYDIDRPSLHGRLIGQTQTQNATTDLEQEFLERRASMSPTPMNLRPEALKRRLKEQGFTIEETRDGWAIKHPNGDGLHHFHPSSLKSRPLAVLKDLEKLGFVSDPDEWKRRVRAERQEQKEKAAGEALDAITRAEEQILPFVCEHCGRRFRMRMHLGRHLTSIHAGEAPPPVAAPAVAAKVSTNGRPAATPVTRKRLPDEELTAVAKVRRLNERIEATTSMLAQDTHKLVELFIEQHGELEDLKARQAKMEKKLAGLVDLL